MITFNVIKKESFNRTNRMPSELIEKLEKLALDNDVSFNQVVVQCCKYVLSNFQ